MKHDNEKYQILSPDGLPITDEPFESRQAALNYIPQWRERFDHQGYYRAIGGRIPLDELTGRFAVLNELGALQHSNSESGCGRKRERGEARNSTRSRSRPRESKSLRKQACWPTDSGRGPRYGS